MSTQRVYWRSMPSTQWTARTFYAMPLLLFFTLFLRFSSCFFFSSLPHFSSSTTLFFPSSFFFPISFFLSPSLLFTPCVSLFLLPPPLLLLLLPLLPFFHLSVPSRALLRALLYSPIFSSPHLIFAEAFSRLAGIRGPKFRSPPPWVSIFKGSHLFSFLAFSAFASYTGRCQSCLPPLRCPPLPLPNTPFTPTVTTSRAHTNSFLSLTEWSTN